MEKFYPKALSITEEENESTNSEMAACDNCDSPGCECYGTPCDCDSTPCNVP